LSRQHRDEVEGNNAENMFVEMVSVEMDREKVIKQQQTQSRIGKRMNVIHN
jgi:hypothetical protein